MDGAAGHVLVVNAGSGSLYVSLFEADGEQQLDEQYLDWTRQDGEQRVHGHQDAFKVLLAKVDVRGVEQ